MLAEKFLRVLPMVLAALTQSLVGEAALGQDQIQLSPASEGHWKVAYHLARPASAIGLVRTPDDARSRRWRAASPDFEIVQVSGKDFIRRIDGAAFATTDFIVPATYVPLPKDYAPFAPFSDGGVLIHSGRFQGCPTNSPEADTACDGPWSMQITSPAGAHILLNGRVHTHSARWVDSDNGTKVYVGKARPRETSHYIGLVDPALPSAIGDLISELLPELIEQYAQRLPPLAQRPMLFTSYDPSYDQGHGHQGGTLPGQVFMHFYGPGWEAEAPGGYQPGDTAWFFAHEAGHLFQHGVSGTRDASWIHEGAAEAFAYLMLESFAAVPGEYLAARRQQAFEGCVEALKEGTLAGAAERGRFSAYYQCGLIVFLAIDTAIRADSADQQDLFGFWAGLIADPGQTETWEADAFLEKVRVSTGPSLVGNLRSLIVEEQDDPAAALRGLE